MSEKIENEDLETLSQAMDKIECLEDKIQQYEKAFREILGVGYTMEFSGYVDFSAKNHEECRKIAIKALHKKR